MAADIVSPDQRSKMMSGIRGKNTKPELAIRSALHRGGIRFRLHRKDLPGSPDLVFPRYNAVLFVHGCFWHGHECHLFRWPLSHQDFWQEKIKTNRTRDGYQKDDLIKQSWRVAILWECALKGKSRLPITAVVEDCIAWLNSDIRTLEIKGKETNLTD